MKILLLGARGQLGRAFFSTLSLNYPHWPVAALGRDECDITKAASLKGAMNRYHPDVIINCAAYTAVDEAQTKTQLAELINHEAVVTLAREARTYGAFLVHFSTDYVFDGSGTEPWIETDEPRPLNIYGTSKYAGEQAIQALCPDHLIVRTSWLYGGEGRHFASTILGRAREGLPLQVVDDQWGAPTQVHWLARMVLSALEQVSMVPGKRGLYHLSSQGETSWYGFASDLVHAAYGLGLLAKPVPVKPISSAIGSQVATRPLNSRLDCGLFSTTFGIVQPSWQEQMMDWLLRLKAEANPRDEEHLP
ncbi:MULTISPECIES: dTDP-4-dehydrorhamnose reductase [Aeromonas]|uniref:dTDP-4-dehydrorhamnose reductase n=1 Tax=Aeromonas TaxID=642 RepID=UPI001C21A236|nr:MULTISPECIES: dTDP-4-dehydrorhamnose reductase [Aeromonas]QXB97608.1 dTDP-4-dehydrorhamnose reductase [Aeromonas sp. FDAARGOS 1418]